MLYNDEHVSELVYGLTSKARSVTAQTGETDATRFLIGTLSLREENQVHLIEIVEQQDGSSDIRGLAVFPHQNEIWNMAPCPTKAELLFTCYTNNQQNRSKKTATLWKLNVPENVLENQLLLDKESDINSIMWSASEESSSNRIVSLGPSTLCYWDIDVGSSTAKEEMEISPSVTTKIASGCWNPHFTQQVAVATGTSVRSFDLRSAEETYCIPKADTQRVCDLDFNRNKPYYIVTGGQDCMVRFWDYRNCKQPMKQLEAHSHWVWNVKYNPFHDQLLITSSTDSIVKLWNQASISSAADAPALENLSDEDDDSDSQFLMEGSNKDHLIKSFDEHEDSVYSLAWSSSNAWLFASLSYDGRVVINHVPQEEQDSILFL